MSKLHGAVTKVEDLVFILDRNKSIEKAINVVFPRATYGVCMYHFGQNAKIKFKIT